MDKRVWWVIAIVAFAIFVVLITDNRDVRSSPFWFYPPTLTTPPTVPEIDIEDLCSNIAEVIQVQVPGETTIYTVLEESCPTGSEIPQGRFAWGFSIHEYGNPDNSGGGTDSAACCIVSFQF